MAHGSSAAAVDRAPRPNRLDRLWGALCLSDGYLASIPTSELLARGLGARAATRYLEGERRNAEIIDQILARTEAHVATAGGRFRDRIYDQAVQGVIVKTRLEQEQEDLLMTIPLELRTGP